MKNIFLIKTPLQLLNAIEAKHYFSLEADDCVLIIMGDRKSQPQILMLASAVDEWEIVVALNDVNMFPGNPFVGSDKPFLRKLNQLKAFKKSIFYVRRLNKISRYFGDVDYIFIGYTRYVYMTHFVNKTNHKNLVFLDDGNGTIELSKQRKHGVQVSSDEGLMKKLKPYVKRALHGIEDDEKESASFFTVYDISPDHKDHVIKNKFNYLRSNVNSLPVIDKVYFIGSPLSEVGIMKEKDYLFQLDKVVRYFSDRKLVYIAHRRDSSEKLKKIEKDLDLEVVLFDYPIEYQLAFIGPRPQILASFFSAALDSCRLIFGDDLKVFSFWLDMKDSPKKDKVRSIYASYEPSINENFRVISDY